LNGTFTQIIVLLNANKNIIIVAYELGEILKKNMQRTKAQNGYTNEVPRCLYQPHKVLQMLYH
jgi:hypothetical protein